MKLFSKKSIIFYSILGLFSLFIARFIRDILDLAIYLEILITTFIIIPMYMLATRLAKKYLL
tara:strand:+ start:11819 stop:12004 length:186 start_codon:yes stop_codon:yes gene_type:complete